MVGGLWAAAFLHLKSKKARQVQRRVPQAAGAYRAGPVSGPHYSRGENLHCGKLPAPLLITAEEGDPHPHPPPAPGHHSPQPPEHQSRLPDPGRRKVHSPQWPALLYSLYFLSSTTHGMFVQPSRRGSGSQRNRQEASVV